MVLYCGHFTPVPGVRKWPWEQAAGAGHRVRATQSQKRNTGFSALSILTVFTFNIFLKQSKEKKFYILVAKYAHISSGLFSFHKAVEQWWWYAFFTCEESMQCAARDLMTA